MTHEVRTPLTAVKGYAEMLMEGLAGPVSEEQAALLGKVLASSDHLLEVVNGVLRIARLKSGKATVIAKACDPEAGGREVCLRRAAAGASEGSHDRCQFRSLRGHGHVQRRAADYRHYEPVTNAVKFTAGRQGPGLDIRGSGTEIVVADSGIGIDEAQIQTILDEFVQLSQPRKYKPAGFGIGLAIVAAMVESIGASLTVSSAKGVGTAFTLRVPVLQA